MKTVTVLIPTKNRITALVATLTSLFSQSYQNFDIVISDQSTEYDILDFPTLLTLQRIFKEHDIFVSCCKHLPAKGLAEQREFLLQQSQSTYSLFLDDDVIMESWVLKMLVKMITQQHCGFVGQAVIGLSYIDDIRPCQQSIEFWKRKVIPEHVSPHSQKWHRHIIHNAANIFHIQQKLNIQPEKPKKYKVAWIGGCVLYDTSKLKDVGGFSFWRKLPKDHVGEDVLAQLYVMEKYGGCGIMPSGVYHQELPTTVVDRRVNAPEHLL